MQKKVLVVDDSQTENQQLCDLLRQHGFETVSAFDAEEGIAAAKKHQPAAILMDVVMPGMNGFQACKEIGKSAETAHIPVLMVSNKHQETDVLWAQKQGAKGYFPKPLDEKALFAKLAELGVK